MLLQKCWSSENAQDIVLSTRRCVKTPSDRATMRSCWPQISVMTGSIRLNDKSGDPTDISLKYSSVVYKVGLFVKEACRDVEHQYFGDFLQELISLNSDSAW